MKKIFKKSIIAKILIGIMFLIMLTGEINAVDKVFTKEDYPYDIVFKKVSAGYRFSVGIDEEGYLWTWGMETATNYKLDGLLGDGKSEVPTTGSGAYARYQPQKISDVKFKTIESGIRNTFAIDEEGFLWAWGNNGKGQLGDGTTDSRCIPTIIKGSVRFSKISAGEQSTAAIDANGDVWVWGFRPIGASNEANIYTPIKMTTTGNFVDVAACKYSLLAIDKEGNLWSCGGSNSFPEDNAVLGNGTKETITTLTQVTTDTNFAKIVGGEYHALAIDKDGYLWSWGRNEYGQLGTGSLIDETVPTLVTSYTKFSKIYANKNSSMAIDEEGYLWAWGDNENGQLGDGSNNNKTSPVKIKRESKFKEAYVSNTHGLMLMENGELWGSSTYVYSANSYTTPQLGVALTYASDGTNVPIQITSAKKEYTVTFVNEGTIINTQIIKSGESAVAPTISKAGYTLSWDTDFSDVTSDLTVNAIWTPNINTPYKIEHYLRTLDTEVETYELIETENKVGTTDALAIATIKSYIGFTENTTHSDRIISGTVAADGSLVLKLYYDRNTYNITYELNGGTATSTLTTTYLYGKQIVLSNRVEKEGYTFAGWYDNSSLTGTAVTSISEQETGNKTFYAKWVENDELTISSTKYTINEEERYITHVSPNTKLTAFLSNITTNGIAEVVNLNGNTISADDFVGTGYKLKVTLNGETKEYEIVVRGDIDGNGKITVTDLSMLNQHIVRRITLTGVKEKAADIEYSGKITVTDLSMMNQALVGRITL